MNTRQFSTFEPRDAQFQVRVRASFSQQRLMTTIGAMLATIAPGHVVIELPFRHDLTQQDDYLHAGIVTAIVDSACGYAALSLMPEESAVLTAEYKVNFVAPARGTHFKAYGNVIKPGRTLTVCAGDVVAITNAQETVIATMLTTMMRPSTAR